MKYSFIVPIGSVLAYLTVQSEVILELFRQISWRVVWHWYVVALFLFVLLHVIKFIRFYLILSESGMHLGRYVNLYLQTTLVNVMLPFKFGEAFRFWLVAQQCESYKMSFLGLLTERFYDTSVITLLLFMQALLSQSRQSITVILALGLFVFMLGFLYFMYPSASQYLNQNIILKRPMKRDLYVLQFLDSLDVWYKYQQKIVHGKGQMLFFCSIISWIIEYGLLIMLSFVIGDKFDFYIFSQYIGDILSFSHTLSSDFILSYNLISIVVFAGVWMLIRIYTYIKVY